MTITLERNEMDQEFLIDEDFFVVDDIDPNDERSLRDVINTVESYVSKPGRLRISILNAEQWERVIKQLIPASQQRTAALHIHTIRDPRDTTHLLISPSAVVGINEDSQVIYQEIIYAVLRCISSPLTAHLRKGADDLIAERCGEKLDKHIFTRHNPQEAALVRGLAEVQMCEFGHSFDNWVLLFRKDPDKFCAVLRKSRFSHIWMSYLGEGVDDSNALTNALLNPDLDMNGEFIAHTQEAIIAYLDGKV